MLSLTAGLPLTASRLAAYLPAWPLAVGAGLLVGEDYPCGGRVLLFEVTRSDGGGGAEGDIQVEMIYSREFKGPITGERVLGWGGGQMGPVTVVWGGEGRRGRWGVLSGLSPRLL